MLEESSFLGEGALEVVGSLVSVVWSSSPYINRVFTRLYDASLVSTGNDSGG